MNTNYQTSVRNLSSNLEKERFEIYKIVELNTNQILLEVMCNSHNLHDLIKLVLQHTSWKISMLGYDEDEEDLFRITLDYRDNEDKPKLTLSSNMIEIDVQNQIEIDEQDSIQESSIKDKNLENSNLYLHLYKSLYELLNGTKYQYMYIVSEDMENENVRIAYYMEVFEKEHLELLSNIVCKGTNIKFVILKRTNDLYVVEYFRE